MLIQARHATFPRSRFLSIEDEDSKLAGVQRTSAARIARSPATTPFD